jgi:hypothetical protein
MARDAISRQYDVDHNRMTYYCEPGKGSYRPGIITFFPKPGKSLDLLKIEESIRATRLSGGTSMSADGLEIVVRGEMLQDAKVPMLKVSGTGQQFVLKEATDTKAKNGAKSPLQRLRESAASGAGVVSVTGYVEGWNGRFPLVLRALGERAPEAPMVLLVTDVETGKK